jgi:hypothetical protein
VKLRIDRFGGVAPAVSSRKLGPGGATKAMNCRLDAAELRPWKNALTVKTGLAAASVSTIYRFGQDLTSDTQYWFHWTADVDVAKGAVADDQTERTYFWHPTQGLRVTNNSLAITGGSGDYPWASDPLGVPAPTQVPVAVVLTPGTGTATETRFYAFTWVTSAGEESAPGPVSADLTVVKVGSTVRLTNIGSAAPAGYTNITAKRIYRTLSGNTTTDFRLVDEIPVAQATYDDSISATALASSELIQTATWAAPPAGAFGLVQMANGIMLTFKGYDVYPSEAYVPYAYPISYSLATDYPIVSGAAFGSSAAILTTGYPYLLTGSDPTAMSLVKLASAQACASKRSIVAIDGGVLYASPDGLVSISDSGAVVVTTANLFSHAEWQKLNPASMHGYYHDGKYFGFYDTGTTQGGFVFEPRLGDGAFTFLSMHATAGFVDLVQDALFLKVGTEIVKFGAGAGYMECEWQSGELEMASPITPACAQVIASAYPVTFRLTCDGALKHTQTVENGRPFRLPSGYRARHVQVALQGSQFVQSAEVATSMAEMLA